MRPPPPVRAPEAGPTALLFAVLRRRGELWRRRARRRRSGTAADSVDALVWLALAWLTLAALLTAGELAGALRAASAAGARDAEGEGRARGTEAREARRAASEAVAPREHGDRGGAAASGVSAWVECAAGWLVAGHCVAERGGMCAL